MKECNYSPGVTKGSKCLAFVLRENQKRQVTTKIYTLFFSLYLTFLSGFSGLLARNFFGWSWVYLGLRVRFCSYKWTQRLCLTFDASNHPISQVNRTARVIAILGFPFVTVGWLVGFYGISTFEGYLTPNPFLCK